MFNDCLTRLPCRWKLINRNSLSVLSWNSGGTIAIRLGTPEPKKVDNATGRCFVRLSWVYNGTQPGLEVNLSEGHSVRRPASWRIGNQWSVMISGGSVSQAAAHGVNRLKELMSSLDGVVPVSNPRRLHLTL